MSEEKTKNKVKKLPVWHSQQELILKNWSEIGSSYRYLHDKSFMKYNSQNLRFALPVIVISTITGTANFAQKSFPESWTTYVPLGIGFLNLTAGLITTIAQFLRVSELLEGHRAASIAYSKFSRNISVELSLPISQRTCNGYDFIVQCRGELDRLIEQSPNIPTSIVNEFASRFKDGAFFKPDILDISPVIIYKNDEEAENKLKEELFIQEQKNRERIIKEEQDKRKNIELEIEKNRAEREKDIKKIISEFKKNSSNNINLNNVNESMDKLLKDLDNPYKNDNNIGKTINNILYPQMSDHKLTEIINEKLDISPEYSPKESSLDSEDNPVHSPINKIEKNAVINNRDTEENVNIEIKIDNSTNDSIPTSDKEYDTINNTQKIDSNINSEIDKLNSQIHQSKLNDQDNLNDQDKLNNQGNLNIEIDKSKLKKQKKGAKFYYFDYDNKIVYNTKYVKIGILDKDQEIVFD